MIATISTAVLCVFCRYLLFWLVATPDLRLISLLSEQLLKPCLTPQWQSVFLPPRNP